MQSVGPLGQFALSPGTAEYVHGYNGNYLPLPDQYGDEMDIDFQSGYNSSPVAPVVDGATLFFCFDEAVCRRDFPPQLEIPGEAEATVA